MRTDTLIHHATVLAATLLAATLTFAAPAFAAAASGATPPAACAKLAKRITAGRATTSAARAKKRGALRRCVVRYRRSTSQRRPPSTPSDTTAPTVAWQEPSAGATVTGKLNESNCTATATDAAGVDRVVFKIDGTTFNTERVVPYNCIVDTTKVADGTHTLTATAYDAAGNSSSTSVSVKVANGEPSEPAPAPVPSPSPESEPAPDPEPSPGDTTAPTVAWQEPSAGATVTGKLNESNCTATATDAAGVDRVVFKIDGTTFNTERVVPYNCIVDTTKVADGTHTLTATAYDAAGNSSSTSVSVKVANTVAAPVPAPEPESAPVPLPSSGRLLIGVDGGYGGWSSTETTYRTQLNAAVTRHEWAPSQPVDAQDALVLKAASVVHTRIHALLGGNELGGATHYREWVVGFIRRYGLGGSFWQEHPELDEARYAMRTFELGNEPYFGGMTATEYADTVRPTLEEVKRLGLPAEIVLPSRVYGTDTSWMDTLYQRIPNLNEYFYAFADHPYWYGHDPAQVSPAGPFQRISVLRKRMNEKGGSAKPIFITEYGESTASCGSECVSEAEQAEHLDEMLSAAIDRTEWKVEMISVFQLLDRGTNSSDRELQFGLLRQNGSQKPSYAVVGPLLQQYRG